MNPRPLFLALWTCWFALGLVPSEGVASAAGNPHSPAPAAIRAEISAAVRDEINASLREIETAANARDLDRILAVYAPDSLLRQDARTRFEGPLSLDSLRCRVEAAVIFSHPDTVEAVVSEETSWEEHDRVYADAEWRSLAFIQEAGHWVLVSDRSRPYAQTRFVDLSIDLHPEEGTLSGRERIETVFTAPGEDHLYFHLNRGLTLRAIEDRDGKPVSFRRTADLVTVALPAPAGGSDSLSFTITFDGDLFNESREQGYSQVGISPEGSFASWVTNWYPRLTGIGSKSRGRIAFTAPAGVTIASSGRAVESSETGGRLRQVFQVDQPLDFSFAAAHYFHRRQDVDGISLGAYFLEGGDAKAELYISTCAEILEFLREVYGGYPFDGYAIVELPSDAVGTLGGSSEQGMNLFPAGGLPDTEFPLPLLSHEIGHSWWGNLVSGEATIIDEGLAQMTAVLCVEKLAGPRAMRRFLRRGLPHYGQSAEAYFSSYAGKAGKDLPLATIPSASDVAMTLHELADDKGFFVYQMLRETIGDDAFTRGLRAAVTAYARKEIHLGDLQRIWERESGRDLGWFFEQWFHRSGAPEFRMTYTIAPVEEGRFRIDGKVTQVGDPYQVTADVVLAGTGGAPQVDTLRIEGPETSFRLTSDVRPDTVLFDPDYRILRWTDEYHNLETLAEVRSLRTAGATDSASAELLDYLARVPDGSRGWYQLGSLLMNAGDLDGAERAFRTVLAPRRFYDFDDPLMARSDLALGEIADLRQRREDALIWYRKVLAQPDEAGSHATASAHLTTPFTRSPEAAADSSMLQRCPGVYSADAGMTVTVSLAQGGVLTATAAEHDPVGLRPVAGTRFEAVGVDGVTFEFEGDGPRYTQLTIDQGGRIFHLQRRTGE